MKLKLYNKIKFDARGTTAGAPSLLFDKPFNLCYNKENENEKIDPMDRRVFILDNEIDFDVATKTLQELDPQIITNHEYDIMMNRYKFVVLFPEGLADKVIEVMRKILTVG